MNRKVGPAGSPLAQEYRSDRIRQAISQICGDQPAKDAEVVRRDDAASDLSAGVATRDQLVGRVPLRAGRGTARTTSAKRVPMRLSHESDDPWVGVFRCLSLLQRGIKWR